MSDASQKEATFRTLGWEVQVPAGTYFLGDPGYAIDAEDEWAQMLESAGYFDDKPVGTLNGQQVIAFNTAHGDGGYRDSDGHRYTVDAGLIGLVPEAVYSRQASYPDLGKLGRIVTFVRPVTCTDDRSGALVFGEIKIDTGWMPEDEKDDGWDDEDSYADEDE